MGSDPQPVVDGSGGTESANALASFTRYLRLLHRLSTTTHATADELFADYLRTGCEIFGVPYGALSALEGGELRVKRLQGTDSPYPEGHAPDELLHNLTTCIRVGEHHSHAFYIGTPILLDGEPYGVIAFWSSAETEHLPLHAQAIEVIELMAKSIGAGLHQMELTRQLAHQAMHDALTGLPNRVLMRERLNTALSRPSSDIQAAVVFIDLDRFKEINDTLGHGIGDGVLQQVARRLKTCLHTGDTLARMGGDEFTAILTGFGDKQDALQRARRMLAAVRTPCRVEGYELFVTGSIGVSFYPFDG